MEETHSGSLPSPGEMKDFLHALEGEVDMRVDIKKANVEEVTTLKVRAEMEREQLRRVKEDNIARRIFSQWIFTVTVVWMFCVLMIVVACGRGSLHLSDGVLIALITTTTANVFGFFYVVVNYLFNKSKST